LINLICFELNLRGDFIMATSDLENKIFLPSCYLILGFEMLIGE